MTRIVLEKKDMERAIVRMTHEIIERNKGVENMSIIGMHRGGVYIANRIASMLRELEKTEVSVGSLDIALYRDDIDIRKDQPMVRKTDVPDGINGKIVVLVDDVLFTGRSIRAALDALMDMGRPSMIQLAVLIDRGHRELPIRADYVGKNIPTALDEKVIVEFAEEGAEDRAMLVRNGDSEKK